MNETIHLSSTACPGSGRRGSSSSREPQTSLSPATSASSDWQIPRRSQASAWVCPGPPPSWTSPEHHCREATRKHPYQMPKPPQLAPFNIKEQRLYSDSSRMTELLTSSLREMPATHLRKPILAACICTTSCCSFAP